MKFGTYDVTPWHKILKVKIVVLQFGRYTTQVVRLLLQIYVFTSFILIHYFTMTEIHQPRPTRPKNMAGRWLMVLFNKTGHVTSLSVRETVSAEIILKSFDFYRRIRRRRVHLIFQERGSQSHDTKMYAILFRVILLRAGDILVDSVAQEDDLKAFLCKYFLRKMSSCQDNFKIPLYFHLMHL